MNSKSREEWDLNHPNDQMPTFLGIDGQYIPERYIPFNSSDLRDHDVIVNENNQYLIYNKEDKSYQLYDSAPNKFLGNPFKEWKKFPVSSEKIRTDQIVYNICMDRIERLLSNNIKLGYSEHNTSIQGDNIIPFTLDSDYFTPSIYDIHVGYECETRANPYPNFVPSKIEDEDDFTYLLNKEWEVRVPYLTKEQIEKEGWIKRTGWFDKEEKQRLGWMPDYELQTDFGSLRLYIRDLENPWKHISIEKYVKSKGEPWQMSSFESVFRGQCKDINTFRYICKLLKIN